MAVFIDKGSEEGTRSRRPFERADESPAFAANQVTEYLSLWGVEVLANIVGETKKRFACHQIDRIMVERRASLLFVTG
jgi:hypothetical protein